MSAVCVGIARRPRPNPPSPRTRGEGMFAAAFALGSLARRRRRGVDRVGVEDGNAPDLEAAAGGQPAEEAGAVAFVARAADLAGLDQQDVGVAVDVDRFD